MIFDIHCKKHPEYKAIKLPVPTKKHPGGCDEATSHNRKLLSERSVASEKKS